MNEKLGQQIDIKQQEIEGLKGPALAKKEIIQYRTTYLQEVDGGQTQLNHAAQNLRSPEAKTYLHNAAGEIAGKLGSIAERGREIIKAHESDTPAKVPTLKDLSGDLKKSLGKLKKSIESFRVLEEIDTKDLPKYEKENDSINATGGSTNPLDVFAKKEKLLGRLNGLSSKFSSTAESRSYSKKVVTRYQELMKLVGAEKDELSLGPMARHIIMSDFLKDARAYLQAGEEVKKSPSMAHLQRLRELKADLDPDTAYSEAFGDRDTGTFDYVENMYKHLEAEFQKVSGQVETMDTDLDESEKEALTEGAKQALLDINNEEKALIQPIWDAYVTDAKNGPSDLDAFHKQEKSLLAAYLTLQATLSPFVDETNIDQDVKKQVLAKLEHIKGKIRLVEVLRQTKKSEESLTTLEVRKYVTFFGEERDGKIYIFNAEFDRLPTYEKERIRIAVENIVEREGLRSKQETQKAQIELNASSGNFEQITEVLGDKAQKYTEGLSLMLSGKNFEAKAAFEVYVGQSFSEEERTAHAVALNDANEKISLIAGSGDFYNGLDAYKNGDANEAARQLKAYVEWAEGTLVDAHKLQIEQARSILTIIGNQKIDQLNTLLTDVKLWKKKEIQDRYGTGGQKLEFDVEGPELDVIEAGIEEIHKKVQNGELIDFDHEFSLLKAKVHLYLQESHAIDSSDNVIDKFAEVYEGLNSSDKNVRKNTAIKFAKELRNYKAYGKAKEYLDIAMKELYKQASEEITPDQVMKQMLENPDVMRNVRDASEYYLKQFKKDNPDASELDLREQAEQMVFNIWVAKRYKRQLRRKLTLNGSYKNEEALTLYNDWEPYEENADTSWYKPWNWKHMDAQEYDDFCLAAKQNVAMTIATLPMGLGAGAAATKVGQFAFRGIATRLLLRQGVSLAGREAAIAAIETGGIMTIRAGSTAFKALAPEVQNIVLQQQLRLAAGYALAGTASVAVEGTLLLAGNHVVEGIITGQASPITTANLVESIVKSTVFRGIGAGGNKLFGPAIKAGGPRAAKAILAMETMSGLLGTGVEAANLYMHGHGSEVNTGMVLRSLLENALTAGGTHLGKHIAQPKSLKEAKRNIKKVEEELGLKFSKPEAIATAYIKDDGVFINGKRTNLDAASLAALPEPAQKRILQLHNIGKPPNELKGIPPKVILERMAVGEIPLDGDMASALIEGGSPEAVVHYIQEGNLDGNDPRIIAKMIQAGKGDKLMALIDSGHIDVHNHPQVAQAFLDTSHGYVILKELAFKGKFKPSRAFAEKMLSMGRKGFKDFETLHSSGDIPKDIADSLSSQHKEKTLLYADSDQVANFFFNAPDSKTAKQNLKDALANPSEKTRLGQALRRFKERDANGYALLRANLDSEQLNIDLVSAIIEGNTIEFTDNSGRRVKVYEGSHLGKGGLGRVFHGAFTVDGNPQFQYQAVKLPLPGKEMVFVQEAANAKVVQGFDSDHINRPLHVSDQAIIYETGKNPMTLSEAFYHLSPLDSLKLYRQALEGVAVYQKNNAFHGDLKGANILVVDTPDGGKRAMLIDNNPVMITPGGSSQEAWPATPVYSPLHPGDSTRGVSNKDVSFAAKHFFDNMSHSYVMVDNYAMAMIGQIEFLHYHADNLPPAVQKNLKTIFADGTDLSASGVATMSSRGSLYLLMDRIDAAIQQLERSGGAQKDSSHAALSEAPTADVNAPTAPGKPADPDEYPTNPGKQPMTKPTVPNEKVPHKNGNAA